MKKRLIVIFSILLVVVLIIILSSTVFTLQNAVVFYYNEEGTQQLETPSNLSGNVMIAPLKGKNMFFLSDDEIIRTIQSNSAYNDYYVIDAVSEFPNTVIIYLAERAPVYYVVKESVGYLVDIKGYVVSTAASASGYVDLTSVSQYLTNVSVGSEITWQSQTYEQRFSYMNQTVGVIWRFYHDYEDIADVVRRFDFEQDKMTVTTVTGAKFVIMTPQEGLDNKITKAYSVYVNGTADVQGNGSIITVDAKGRVITE